MTEVNHERVQVFRAKLADGSGYLAALVAVLDLIERDRLFALEREWIGLRERA